MANLPPLFQSKIDKHYALPPTNYCIACIPGRDTANEFTDISGNNAHIIPDISNSTAFSVPGGMKSGSNGINSTNACLVIPAEKFVWSPSTEWLIFHFELEAAIPASITNLIGISASNNSGYTGFYISHRTTGALKIVPVINGVNTSVQADSTLIYSESVPRRVSCQIAFDPTTGSWFMYKEGILSDAFMHKMIGANAYPAGTTNKVVRFGGMSGPNDYGTAYLFGAVQIYKGVGNLPVSIGSIVKKLSENPAKMLSNADFTFPNLKGIISLTGQSNEATVTSGSPTYRSINNGDGAPAIDGSGLLVNNSNGRWPKFQGALGSRGVWGQVTNTAVGSTALSSQWVGKIKNYVVGMLVGPGSYVIDANGHIYKAVQATYAAYTLNVTPSSGVGTSGLTSWTDLGLASSLGAQYVDDYVCVASDSLFDPNGLCLAAKNAVVGVAGYNFMANIISIGQGDKTVLDTANVFRDAIISAANYYTSFGIHVFVAMTFTSPLTGVDAYYTTYLLPGRAAALTALSSNPLVHEDANLATLIGVLPLETSAQPAKMIISAAMLQDGLHANWVANSLAANYHDQYWELAGF